LVFLGAVVGSVSGAEPLAAGTNEVHAWLTNSFRPWLTRSYPEISSKFFPEWLHDHPAGLLPTPFSLTPANCTRVQRHLIDGARTIERGAPDWPAPRVLSCLYLWACEIGRFCYCDCGQNTSPLCPLRSLS